MILPYCGIRLINENPEVIELIEDAQLALDSSILPVGGGLLNQSVGFYAVFKALISIRNEVEAGREESNGRT